MKTILLLLALGVALGTQAPPQTPREGPYAHQDGHRCWRHPDQVFNELTFHQCGCKLHCDEHGNAREDYDCQTACNAKNQCVCHADEGCEPRGRR